MNEKRFTIINMGLDGRYIEEDGKIMEIDRVVELLNENDELKQEIKRLQDFESFYRSQNMRLIKENSELCDENEQLKQFQEKVAEVIEGKMGDNVCNDYKMEVLKEIWNELELDEVWFE